MDELYIIYSKMQDTYFIEGKTSTQSFSTFKKLLKMYPDIEEITVHIVTYY